MLEHKPNSAFPSCLVRDITVVKQHLASIRRLKTRNNVVLPDPDGPSSAVRLLAGTRRSTPDNA